MTTYHPDAWVILKLTNKDEVIYKVFAGWYGGYLGSDSWKMNSGITKVEEVNGLYLFHGESGSVYECHPNTERMTGYMSTVFHSFASQQTDDLKIECIDYEEYKNERG